MTGLIDDQDVRRPNQIPRLSTRVATDLECVFFQPSRRKTLLGATSERAVKAKIVNLSFGGALVLSPTNDRIQVGAKLKLECAGHTAIVVVRSIRPTSNPDLTYYGVEFLHQTGETRDHLAALLEGTRR